MTYPQTRPDYPRSSGQPQAGYCKNCKRPIEDESSGFCDASNPSDVSWCWTDWCRKQDEKQVLRGLACLHPRMANDLGHLNCPDCELNWDEGAGM